MWKRCMCLIWLMVVLGSTAYGAFDPLKDPNLIGWWKCDEGQGSVVGDSGPGKHDGTFVVGSPAWTTGVSGSAISLSGNTVVEVPAIPNLKLTQATMAGWVLPNGAQSDWASFIMHRDAGNASGFNLLGSRQLAYHWNDDSASWSARFPAATYAADEWTHCAVTIEPTKATFYLNGVAMGTNNIAHAVSNWTGPIWFGGDRTYTGSRHLNGALDEITFFSRALKAAEVKDLVTPRPKARKPNPADGATNVSMSLFQWTAGDNAIFHNVYMGTTPDLTEANLVGKNQPFAMYFHVAGLTPGAVHYWRVDEVDAAGTVTTGDIWKFTATPKAAWTPKPADGGAYVAADVTLEWSAGMNATTHDVYLGTDRAAVEAGAADTKKATSQAATTFKTSGLERGKTYYWRVDEVLAGGVTVAGDVWSFTVRPVIAKTDPDLVGWWKLEDEKSGLAVDYSGSDNYGTIQGAQWVEGIFGDALQFSGAQRVDLPPGLVKSKLGSVTCWVKTTQTSTGTIFYSNAVTAGNGYGGENELHLNVDTNQARFYIEGGNSDVSVWSGTPINNGDWQHVAVVWDAKTAVLYLNGAKVAQAGNTGNDFTAAGMTRFGQPAAAERFYNGVLDDVRLFSKALSADEVAQTMRGDPLLAWDPQPGRGVNVDIRSATALKWSAGEKATKHDVYFGKDKDAVKAGDTTSPLYKGRQTGTSFSLDGLVEFGGGSYFWRIDEVEADGTTIHKGAVWSFTVPAYLIVDEFESYNDDVAGKTTIYDTWIDGLTDGLSGSVVGNNQAPFAERTIVHGGKQAMPMDFNNAKTPFYSEAVQTFAPLQDWTGSGVTDLSLWFRGNPVRFVDKGNGAFTVGASGHDIWDNADDFRFVYKKLNGNGSVTVKVESLVNTNGWAKAGVMIRDNLTGGSAMAYMIQSFSSGASFGWRQVADGTCGSQTQAGIAAPQWVKLTRTGNAFTAQYSADGKTWTDIKNSTGQVVSTTILMGANVYIGICTTSHNTAATTTAEYSGAATTGNVTGQWQVAWVGDDPDRTNSTAPLYAVVEDSAGKSAVAVNPDSAAVNVGAWTEWKMPLSSLTGVNLAKVKKLYIGVGDKKTPAADGSGRIYIDDIHVVKP